MGTALRNLVKDKKKEKITLGGKGYGTLTETKMVKLQKYYQNAILKHKNDVPAMKNAILATLYHAVSNDSKPQHQLCPKGSNSWCFYQAAVSQNRTPASHTKHVGTALKPEFLEFLLPIYERLSSENLLRRCTGLTQNANESLHSVIWAKCQKNSAPTISRVQMAVAQGICEFNFGVQYLAEKLSEACGLQSSRYSEVIGTRCDALRIQKYNHQKNEKVKAVSRIMKEAKEKREKEIIQQEGTSYGAGQF